MGEILRIAFRLSTFLSLTFLLVSISEANGATTSRALVPYTGKQCPALFQSKPNVVPSPPKIWHNTGFFDSAGQPIMRAVDPSQMATLNAANSWLTIADSAPVYSAKTIKDILGGSKKLHEEVRSLYEEMDKKGADRFLVKPSHLEALDHLYKTMPNFKEPLDHIRKSLAISLAAGEPVRFRQMILLGDPGLGKTHFAQAVSQVLGTGFDFISMNNITAGWVLSGAHVTWKGASLGTIARILIEKDSANPVVVVDEIDKAGESEGQRTLTSLHQLWEKKTARAFRDEFLGLDVDASHINWIATANLLVAIPETIRGRATIFEIKKPTEQQMRAVVPNIMKVVLAEHPRLPFLDTIHEDVFQRIHNFTPREVAAILEDAMGNAVLAGRREILATDINVKAAQNEPGKKNRIGFL